MKILVTGAGGLLGQHLSLKLEAGFTVAGYDRHRLDITDANQLREIFELEQPDAVVNCAAMTGVDACELNPEAAFLQNAEGPGLLAAACRNFGVYCLHLSTDYVFDGQKQGAYEPDDPPHPISVYGKSKLAGEQAVQSQLSNAGIVRVAGLYGAGGRNFASLLETLLTKPGTIRAVADNVMLTTYVVDAAVRLKEILTHQAGGIFHVTNSGKPSSWFEFAQVGAELLGPRVHAELVPVPEAELKRPAPRPMNSTLTSSASTRLGLPSLRDWREALAEHLGVGSRQ